jgi:hypothetical protein
MSFVPNELQAQVFWEGLSRWYSYVVRSPHLFGHIMLAYAQEDNHPILTVPPNFERALRTNMDFLLKWANKYKQPTCHPVFYRMNISGEQFRVHIIPVSKQEIEGASASLAARVPALASRKGGFMFYLGNRENIAEHMEAEYREVSGNHDATKDLFDREGILTIVQQFRKITGYRMSK